MTTLRRRLVLSHVGLAGALMLLGALYVGAVSRAERNTGIRSGAERDAAVLAERVRDVVDQPSRVRATLTQEVSARRQAEVVDDTGAVVAVEERGGNGPPPISAPPGVVGRALDGESGSALWHRGRAVFAAAPIVRNEAIVGAAVVVEDTSSDRAWTGPIWLELAVGAFLVVVAAAVASALAEGVAGPIRSITDDAHRLALGEPVDGEGPRRRTSVQELATLRAAFQRVRERTAALQERTRTAETTRAAALRRVSHQLRTPLSVIALRLDDVAERRRDERRRAVAIIDEQIGRLAALGDELSRQARATTTGPQLRVVDVAAATRDAVTALLPLAQWSGVHLHLDTRGPLPAAGVASLLDDAITNIIENAIKFTPRSGDIHVRARRDADGVVVEVEDEGPGIAPAERQRVRRPWVRGASADGTPGSGIGLSLVEEAMAVVGGTLDLLDGRRGLLVRLRIPLHSPPPAAEGTRQVAVSDASHFVIEVPSSMPSPRSPSP